jgi:hypothetical protein
MQARIAQADPDREAPQCEQEAMTLRAAAERDTAINLAQCQGPGRGGGDRQAAEALENEATR